MLRFILFVHLIISKVSLFYSNTAYNTDFSITLNQLANILSIISFNL